ncbi:MAG: 3-dehydroquinate dehydratase [Flavobacteriales bacterium]|nr:3-dehydroquinate dehydratase [Flavobacteriales bacterium]
MKVIIINGPNLNLLEHRNKDVYGIVSFDDYYLKLKQQYAIQIDYYQSNIEGELIDKIQEIGFTYDYIILNAGGYTHTSVAIADCVELISCPVIEVHISNIYSRETFRQKSLLSKHCVGCIVGLGLNSYNLAIDHIISG